MKLSIIIPTHNRAKQLSTVLESIKKLSNETSFEVIVVDNNSNDDTYIVAKSYSDFVKYVFEGSTAFTKARMTGAENAIGEFLLYLDDDVILNKGSLGKIINIFTNNLSCGVIAGKVSPYFIENPKNWTIECQKIFNAWSLFDGDTNNSLKKGSQEVESACGPMMAIRKNIFFQVNGFPPDTIGVETNDEKKNFKKLYIGPGDYGLCYKIKKIGYKIIYHPSVSVLHVIPPFRLKIEFFRSRMIGEAHHVAITQRKFFNYNFIQLFFFRLFYFYSFKRFRSKLLKKLKRDKVSNYKFQGIYPEELHYWYFKSILEIDEVLKKKPSLSKILWDVGINGIENKDYENFLNKMPADYMRLINSKNFYNPDLLEFKNLNKNLVNENFYSKMFYLWASLGFFIRIFFFISKLVNDYLKKIKINK